MKASRLVLPALVICTPLVALAWAEHEPGSGSGGKLVHIFKVGDSVTLGSRNVSNPSHSLTLLSDEELKSIQARFEEYEEERVEYDEKVAMLRDLVESAGDDRVLRSEMLSRQREFARQVRRPTKPPTLYQVLTVGEDYIGILSEGSESELLINGASIRSVSRKAAAR